MLELKGKYNKDCKVFAEEVENEAISLIQAILDERVSDNVPVRIMPDVHAGKSIVIGFTMPLTNLLSPAFVGVDIGCGMLSAKFSGTYKLNLEQLDTQIRNVVPVGFNVHGETMFKDIPFDEVQRTANLFTTKFNEKFGTDYVAPTYSEKWLENKLKDIKMDGEKFWKSIGSLGGGNHFIEVGKDSNSDFWVTVHTGSRNFGLKIADYWTNVAKGKVVIASKEYNKELNNIFDNTVPKNLIPVKVKELKEKYGLGIDKSYLSNENLMGYLYDMIFAQKYAEWNRDTILSLIKDKLKIKDFDEVISTIHNYIDFNDFIIRKGAISSYKGDKMIIPFNMRDGILLCEGKSNEDWNFSAPHGAGRVMSRTKAKQAVDLDKFKESMKGIYSTSVNKNTLDESPFAYKKSEMIEKAIEPTATILDRIKPILNIKDSGKSESWKERKKKMKKRNK
jgi:tRNA-splicing ligase RtcB (3'-phosphate/5'-hydroxy nucleic acid ligase)